MNTDDFHTRYAEELGGIFSSAPESRSKRPDAAAVDKADRNREPGGTPRAPHGGSCLSQPTHATGPRKGGRASRP